MITANYIWSFSTIIAVILLFFYWHKKNAVWGGLTLGATTGLIISIIFAFNGAEFNWYIVGKGATTGTFLGFVAELLGKLSDFLRKK